MDTPSTGRPKRRASIALTRIDEEIKTKKRRGRKPKSGLEEMKQEEEKTSAVEEQLVVTEEKKEAEEEKPKRRRGRKPYSEKIRELQEKEKIFGLTEEEKQKLIMMQTPRKERGALFQKQKNDSEKTSEVDTVEEKPGESSEVVAESDAEQPEVVVPKKRTPFLQRRRKGMKRRPPPPVRKPKKKDPVNVTDENVATPGKPSSGGASGQSPSSFRVVKIAVGVDEDSQSGLTNGNSQSSQKKKKPVLEVFDPDSHVQLTADQIAEYSWGKGEDVENFMLQEQISNYLGVKSFKRKYPDLCRRTITMEERNALMEHGIVSETQCDLGLTAIPSHEILDIMCNDFPEKYDEYKKVTQRRQQKEMQTKQKALATANVNIEKNKMTEFLKKVVKSAASFNSNLNKERREERRYCMDLQTFCIHSPQSTHYKLDKEYTQVGKYPVSLIPGQYTDYCRSYNPTELRRLPLSTVLYGPLTGRKDPDLGSDASQSDSEDSSSSDDSSSTSGDSQGSEETVSTEDSQQGDSGGDQSVICKVCSGTKKKNKNGQAEVLINCAQCSSSVHPSCVELSLDMVPHIRNYDWQCTDCKTCNECHDPADEDKMLFCDMCDRGFHIYCVGLRRVPTGRWHCMECAKCASCGTRDPGGAEVETSTTPSAERLVEWQHEYRRGDKGVRTYVQTLCIPCSKLWKKSKYCQYCLRCYRRPDMEGMISCNICEKFVHTDCIRSSASGEQRFVNYICGLCLDKQKGKSAVRRRLY